MDFKTMCLNIALEVAPFTRDEAVVETTLVAAEAVQGTLDNRVEAIIKATMEACQIIAGPASKVHMDSMVVTIQI
jgi:hypothetical protein